MPSEVDFLPVGDSNGDAIIVRVGPDNSFHLYVIDGGRSDTGTTVIEHIERWYGAHVHINHMVLTHADNDHATGLVKVLERFDVKALWMNRPWLYAGEVIDSFHGNFTVAGLVANMRDRHPYLVDLENEALRRNIPINEVFQGAKVGAFTVLAPSRQRYIDSIPDLDKTPASYAAAAGPVGFVVDAFQKAINAVKEAWDVETLDSNPPATSVSNETCVVQLGNLDGKLVLLTADAGPIALNEAADFADKMGMLSPPNLVQIPHHGSRRNVTPAVLDRWLGTRAVNGSPARGNAIVSIGKDADIYPRKRVKNAFIRRGYPVYATRGRTLTQRDGINLRNGWHNATAETFSVDVDD